MRKDEEDWTLFKEALLNSIDKSIPSKCVSGRDKLPWLSPHLRRLIRRKNCLQLKNRQCKASSQLANDQKDIELGPRSVKHVMITLMTSSVTSGRVQSPFGNSSLLAESDLDKARSLNQQFCLNFSSEDTESRS